MTNLGNLQQKLRKPDRLLSFACYILWKNSYQSKKHDPPQNIALTLTSCYLSQPALEGQNIKALGFNPGSPYTKNPFPVGEQQDTKCDS